MEKKTKIYLQSENWMSDFAFLWTLSFLEQQYEKEKPFSFQIQKMVVIFKYFFFTSRVTLT